MHWSCRGLTVAMLIAFAGCVAPAAAPSGPAPSTGAPAAAPAKRKSLEILLPAKLNAFITAQGLVGQNARPSRYFHEFVNGYVTVRDHEDEVAPHLASVSKPGMGTFSAGPGSTA